MAKIRKRHNRYQAQVRLGLVSRSASFSTRAEARAWAAGIEAVLLAEMKALENWRCSSKSSKTPIYICVVTVSA